MFGQLSEQVLILEDVGVWVKGGEGVEEEGDMEAVGELECRSVNSCESTWAPIFSLTIASIFHFDFPTFCCFGFPFLTIYVCFLSFDHIDGLITDRVVRYCCQN